MEEIKFIRMNCPLRASSPEAGQKAIEVASELIGYSLKDAGVKDYDLFQSITDSSFFLIFETWKDQASLDVHMRAEHFVRLVPQVQAQGEMGIEQINVTEGIPADFKAIRMNCPFTAKKGEEAAVEALSKELVAASLKDAGVIAYDVLKSTTRPGEYLVFETWKDQPSLTKHMASQHFVRIIPQLQEKGELKIDQLYI